MNWNIKYYIIGLVLFSFAELSAQKNHDYSELSHWLYQLEMVSEDMEIEQIYVPQQIDFKTLKIANQYRFYEDDFMLGLSIRESMENGKFIVYHENGEVISLSEISSALDTLLRDTVVTVDYDSYEEHVQITTTTQPKFPTENVFYRFSQNWNYNSKKQELINSITKVEVVKCTKSLEDASFLFSIKNKDKKRKKNIRKIMKSNTIIWAKEININGDFTNVELREKLLSKKHLTKHTVVDFTDEAGVELSWENIVNKLGGTVDTLLDYKVHELNPEVNVVKGQQLTADNITKFKVVQDIYFDTKTHSFSSRVVAIAPLNDIYSDGGGELLYSLPIFWIVYDEDYLTN